MRRTAEAARGDAGEKMMLVGSLKRILWMSCIPGLGAVRRIPHTAHHRATDGDVEDVWEGFAASLAAYGVTPESHAVEQARQSTLSEGLKMSFDGEAAAARRHGSPSPPASRDRANRTKK